MTDTDHTSTITALQEAAIAVKDYALKLDKDIEDEKLFDEIVAGVNYLASSLEKLNEYVKAKNPSNPIPSDMITELTTGGLEKVAHVLVKVGEFDKSRHYSSSLYTTVKVVILKAESTLNQIKEVPSSISNAASHTYDSVKSEKHVQNVITSVESLRDQLVKYADDHVVLSNYRDAVKTSVTQLTTSLDHLKSKPTKELPFVAVAEALVISKVAISSFNTALIASLPDPIGKLISSTQAAANDAISSALSYFSTSPVPSSPKKDTSSKPSIVSAAVHLVDSGANITLSKLAEIDRRFEISSKAIQTDKIWGASDTAKGYVATGLAAAKKVDEKLGLLEKAQSVDNTLLGGRATSAVTSAWDLGTQLAADLLSRYSQFLAAPAENGAVAPSASEPTSSAQDSSKADHGAE